MKNQFIQRYFADTEVGAKLTLDAGQATTSLKQFKQELKSAQGEALALADKFGPTSKAALEAAKRVAELRDRINDANETARLFDPGAKFQAVGNAVHGLVGGFTALQGAMGLLGIESEDTQKALLKVQSAMALLQGLNVVADMTKDFQRLSAVITQTTAFQKINNATTAAASTVMKAFGVSVNTTSTSFKVLKGAIAATGIGALLVLVGEAISFFDQLTSAANEAAEAEKRALEVREKGAAAFLSGREEEINRQEKLLVAEAKAAGKGEKEIFNIEQTSRRLRIAAIKDYIQEVGTQSEAGHAAQKRLAQEETDLRIAALNEQSAARKRGLKDLKKDIDDERILLESKAKGIGPDRITFDNSDNYLDQRDKEVRADQESADKRVRAFERVRDLSKSAADSIVADMQRQQLAADETRKKDEEASNARVQAAYAVGNSLGALSNLIGRQTAAGKALAIAQAVINTWLGATEVLRAKSVLPEPAGTIAKIANVAVIVASGLNAIKNIVKAQVPGGGGQAPSFQTPAPIQPRVPQATQTLLDQSQLNQIGNATVRAFVVERDMTNNQERVRILNRAARI